MARYQAREASYLGDKLYEAGEIAEISDDLDIDIGENWRLLDARGNPVPDPPKPAATRHRPIQPAGTAPSLTPPAPERHAAAPLPPAKP